jgi:hypothetical protein
LLVLVALGGQSCIRFAAGTYNGLKEQFVSWNATLERVIKRLETFLDGKRAEFKRFYFIVRENCLFSLETHN